jgi:hypothetical protein
VHDGREVGTVTSVAPVPDGSVALALVSRSVDPPTDVRVAWDGGEVGGRVESVPS